MVLEPAIELILVGIRVPDNRCTIVQACNADPGASGNRGEFATKHHTIVRIRGQASDDPVRSGSRVETLIQ